MSKLPFMPLYVADYEAATAWLTLAQDGLYSRTLRLMWLTPNCTLPNDKAWLMRRLRITEQEYENDFLVIKDEFFQVKRGRIMQKRLHAEFGKAKDISNERSIAGKKGVKAKALKNNKKTESKEGDLLTQKDDFAEASTLTSTSTKKTKAKNKTSISENHKLTDKDKAYGKEKGMTEGIVKAEAEKFINYHLKKDTLSADWAASWRTWVLQGYWKQNNSGGGSSPQSKPFDFGK